MVLYVTETFDFLNEEKRRISIIDDNLSVRILMLILIKSDEGIVKMNVLADKLERDRGTIRDWIKKYRQGGYDEILTRHYENIKRSREREGWVMNNEIVIKIKDLIYDSNIKFKSKIDLYEYLKLLLWDELRNHELNKWTFYKRLKKIISNEKFKQLMSKK